MRSQGEISRAYEIADVLDDEQIDARQVKLVKRTLQHHGVEMALTASVDLHGQRAGGGGAVGVKAGGDVTVDDCQPQPSGQTTDRLLHQAGLARTGRGQKVDAEDAGGVEPGAVVGRQPVVGAEDFLDDRYALDHGVGSGVLTMDGSRTTENGSLKWSAARGSCSGAVSTSIVSK